MKLRSLIVLAAVLLLGAAQKGESVKQEKKSGCREGGGVSRWRLTATQYYPLKSSWLLRNFGYGVVISEFVAGGMYVHARTGRESEAD